jgi:hypothetical protein
VSQIGAPKSWKSSRKKSSKKSSKKVQKKSSKKSSKKSLKNNYLKLQIVGGEGRGGEGGELSFQLSFQCLRPSTLLMAAGKNTLQD